MIIISILLTSLIEGCFTEDLKPEDRLWPLPNHFKFKDRYFLLAGNDFKFYSTLDNCLIMDKAFQRYYHYIFSDNKTTTKTSVTNSCKYSSGCNGVLTQLIINLANTCEDYPYLAMNESYELSIKKDSANLRADSIWGILRGLETFSQTVFSIHGQLAVTEMYIKDAPLYRHRGILLDTARHYIPKKIILKNLDAMEMNKLNVFHWHIVDDQSFPYQSMAFPELSKKGAYSPVSIYTPDDIRHIVEYARRRGIRVIVEFDSPGHTEVISKVKKELLTKCKRSTLDVFKEQSQPLNPLIEATYTFVRSLLEEFSTLFPDDNIHLGGDEIRYSCWEEAFGVRGEELASTYFYRMHLITRKLKKIPIVWQDVMEASAVLGNESVIVQVWKENDYDMLFNLMDAGYYVLFSSCWYFDHVHNEEDWKRFYTCNLQPLQESEEYLNFMLGGEGCLWSEQVDASNLLPRLWPRAVTIAERLWTVNVESINTILQRIKHHRCNMIRRGIPAEPQFGPGFCSQGYDSIILN